MITYYLSGPMSVTDKPDMNYSEFNRIEKMLVDDGYNIVNPVNLDKQYDTINNGYKDQWTMFLARDIKYIIDNQINDIILIDHWEDSLGSKMEIFIIKYLFKGNLWKFVEGEDYYQLQKININFKIEVDQFDKKDIVII